MTIIYFAGNTKPEKRTCEKFGYPNIDSEGKQQFENTHFLRIEDAWERVFAEAKAGVSIDARLVKELRDKLLKAESSLCNSVLELQEVEQNYEDFKNGNLAI